MRECREEKDHLHQLQTLLNATVGPHGGLKACFSPILPIVNWSSVSNLSLIKILLAGGCPEG